MVAFEHPTVLRRLPEVHARRAAGANVMACARARSHTVARL